MTNVKTWLAEAYTCTGTCTSKITDLGFSYSATGQTTDTWGSSPNSGGYYHVTTSYWPNGVVSQLSGLPSLPTISYGVDGEGRWSTVSASSGQNPVTAATYATSGTSEPIGALTQVTFGSGDSESYQYDTNTGKLKQYSFNVDGQSAVGNLAWNTNGTAQSLAITDPFNSQDNQTCAYTHDDLGRVSASNCGSAWSQTFTYDPFGNVTKTGSVSWQPGYDTTSNRYMLNGTSYDANGNLNTDTFNTYTWDGSGNLATVNGATVTNDALGRMVENNSRGFEEVYSSAGGSVFAAMQGQSIAMVYVPLPGGVTAAYVGSGLVYYFYPDWLGSLRLMSTPGRSALPMMAYAPFGEGYAGGTPSFVEFTAGGYSLTVLDNENQTGSLEDFMFRRYSPTQGRWISPDPAGIGAANPSDPQSWNRYAYVGNRPLQNTDPTGLILPAPCDPEDPDCWWPEPCDPEDPYGCNPGPIIPPLPPGGSGPPGGPPPQSGRKGGVWPNNETLGLPGGLNTSPLASLEGLLGLLPGLNCGVGTAPGSDFGSTDSSACPVLRIVIPAIAIVASSSSSSDKKPDDKCSAGAAGIQLDWCKDDHLGNAISAWECTGDVSCCLGKEAVFDRACSAKNDWYDKKAGVVQYQPDPRHYLQIVKSLCCKKF